MWVWELTGWTGLEGWGVFVDRVSFWIGVFQLMFSGAWLGSAVSDSLVSGRLAGWAAAGRRLARYCLCFSTKSACSSALMAS